MRLFTAIEIPETIKKQIYRQVEKFSKLTPVRQEQLHLTLRFIGETDPALLPAISAALRQICLPAIKLQITGTGFFPSARHPQIFWIGFNEAPELAALKKSIDTALAPLIPNSDDRIFIPHITLFRFKKQLSCETLTALTKEFNQITSESFTAQDFRLFSSELKSSGSIHTLQESFPLSL